MSSAEKKFSRKSFTIEESITLTALLSLLLDESSNKSWVLSPDTTLEGFD
jgi:hypothetical protein